MEPVVGSAAPVTVAGPAAVGPEPAPPEPPRHEPPSPAGAPPAIRRLRAWIVAAGLVALAFGQQPGLVIGDTKTDLVLDPGGFLGRALHAWDPQQAFGQLSNQSYGYLWPMGPFFWLGHALHVPPWVVQRSWWALILLVGFVGTVLLAGALRIGTPTTRLIGAVCYAASARVLSVLGLISVEALPQAVLPWVLLPLVLVGSGRLTVRRGAALSGLAVACVGAVNAAATLAVLPLPVLYLLTRPRGTGRRRLAAYWSGAVLLGTAWWLLPLLVLGRYAYPFLDQIENAGVTTQVTTVANTLRGTSHWLGYLLLHGRPRWPAGFDLAVSPVPVIGTAAVAAAGLAGLLRYRGPHRRWLLLGVVLGTTAIAVGHAGTLTSPLAPAVRDLLDGPLAPFRNVHKFDPVLRLPIALGVAHLLALAVRRTARLPAGRAAAGRDPAGRVAGTAAGSATAGPAGAARAVGWWPARGTLRATLGAVVLVGLAATATPAWGGRLAPDGGYPGLPGYWRAAAGWLAAHDPDHGRTLLVPSSNFADYQWGSPVDEPLQGLARSPWAVRNAVPLGAPGATRLLDAIDARLATGQPSAALAPVLARAGVRYVLLRNDIDVLRSGSERPAVVRSALAGSPGLAVVASFGPAQRTGFSGLDTVSGASGGPPAVEVFQVAAPGGPADVASYPRAGALALSGGPEGVLDLADAGLLDDRAVLATADLPPAAGGSAAGGLVDGLAVTDTLRRRALNFGGDPGRRYGPTLPADADPAGGRPAGDVEPYGKPDATRQSVAVLDGAAEVTASSSAADPFAAAYRGPDRRPAAAFDRDPDTGWVSDAGTVGEWLELTLPDPVNAAAAEVTLVNDPALGPTVTRLRVTTDAGSRVVPVDPGAAPQRVPLPPGATSRLRLTVDGVASTAGGGVVGIREVVVPGVTVSEAVALPTDGVALERSGLPWTALVGRAPGRRGDCVRPDRSRLDRSWACVAGLAAAGEEVSGLDRRFRTAAAAGVSVRPMVQARPGPALDALLDSALGYRAVASSTATTDPIARPGAAYDGDVTTAWVPAGSDVMPQLRLDLGSTFRLQGVRLVGTDRDYAGVARVVLTAGDQRRELQPKPGTQWISPLPAREITLTMARRPDKDGRLPAVRLPDVVLLGAPARADGTVRLPCGAGPTVGLDGAVLRTAVTAPVSELVTLAPVAARACRGPVQLGPGEHRLVEAWRPDRPVELAGAQLTGDRALPSPGPARAVEVLARTPESRRLRVAAGAAGFLALAEGFNAGWRATAGGQPLTPVRLDGWRQGWLLPAGGEVQVDLVYAPGRWHRAGLLTGVAALLVLVALALPAGRIRLRRRPATALAGRPDGSGAGAAPAHPGPTPVGTEPAPTEAQPARAGPDRPSQAAAGRAGPDPVWARTDATPAGPGLGPMQASPEPGRGGPVPAGESTGVVPGRSRGWAVAGLVLAVVVPVLLAGPAGVLAAAVAVGLPARWRAAVAAGCLAVGGLVLGVAPTWSAQPAVVQLLAVTALAVAAAAVAPGSGSLLTGSGIRFGIRSGAGSAGR